MIFLFISISSLAFAFSFTNRKWNGHPATPLYRTLFNSCSLLIVCLIQQFISIKRNDRFNLNLMWSNECNGKTFLLWSLPPPLLFYCYCWCCCHYFYRLKITIWKRTGSMFLNALKRDMCGHWSFDPYISRNAQYISITRLNCFLYLFYQTQSTNSSRREREKKKQLWEKNH